MRQSRLLESTEQMGPLTLCSLGRINSNLSHTHAYNPLSVMSIDWYNFICTSAKCCWSEVSVCGQTLASGIYFLGEVAGQLTGVGFSNPENTQTVISSHHCPSHTYIHTKTLKHIYQKTFTLKKNRLRASSQESTRSGHLTHWLDDFSKPQFSNWHIKEAFL